MDETGITMMAFPRGNKDPQSHHTTKQSFQDEGYTVSHSASLSFSHTQTTYTSNAQHINQNPLILHKVKQKERKKSNFLGSGREKSTSCIWYNVYMRERHNKEEAQEYHIQKRANIRQSLVRPESGPERRLRGFWAT